MTRLRLAFLVALSIMGLCCLVPGALPVILTLPLRPTLLAEFFGYETARGIPRLGESAVTLLFANVAAASPQNLFLRGEIDDLVLRDLKLTYRLGGAPGENSGLSFLERLPTIRRLDVQNAEVLLVFEGGERQVTLTDFNLAVRDFSPKTGGSIALRANFAAEAAGGTAITVSGRIRGEFELADVQPRPHGKGTVEVLVDSARYTSGKREASLGGLRIAADIAYDRQLETVAIGKLRAESDDFGTVSGTAKFVLRGDMPWSAGVSAASTDLARVFAAIQPLLPDAYRAWTVQGHGTAEAQATGRFGAGRRSLDGAVVLSLSQGGASSSDGTRAAQGVGGRLVLKLAYVSSERKLLFNVQAEQRDGEYLWGTYYTNLAGRQASLAVDGDYLWDGPPHFELTGSMDIFQTGDYSFNASGKGSDWALQFKGAEVSHARIVELLLKAYLTGLSPRLASLSVTGVSTLETTIRREGDALAITGTYMTDGASLSAPDLPLSIQGIGANVPFALRYPAIASPTATSPRPGFVRLDAIQRRRLNVDDLRIPLIVSENRLEVPEPIVVPFFGGQVHLYGLQIDDVLFPTRYRFGIKVANVDLGRMTRRLTGVEYPGTVNADLGMMRYENNRIASEGRAIIDVFGGEIEATDLFAENIMSPSWKLGGDITFRDISLEELTRKIAVGKMTGVIQGSLRNFTMEYGEPASFVLDLESVPKRGVSQSISMDAIQSISILGTGAGSALNQGIARLFREYPYSKIGLRCVLKNDQFSVNGTIHEGGKEYLVRRGLFRGVDVVNQNPKNVISFSDMEERIKRISRPAAMEPGGITIE